MNELLFYLDVYTRIKKQIKASKSCIYISRGITCALISIVSPEGQKKAKVNKEMRQSNNDGNC
jgi:hypothetical protein